MHAVGSRSHPQGREDTFSGRILRGVELECSFDLRQVESCVGGCSLPEYDYVVIEV